MGRTPVNLATVGETLEECITQILMLIAYWIDWLFTEHLLLANVVSAALLLGLADFSIQMLKIFILGTKTRFDRVCNYRSMQVGMVLGVFNHIWYAFLDAYLEGNGLPMVFKKIALDQAIAGPFFSSAYLVGMCILEGKSTRQVYDEWSQKFIHIYMVDWMFWPLAQFINFYLVPFRFRVFYVNFATFLWNTFLTFAKHHSEEEMIKLQRGNDHNSSDVIYHRMPEEETERNDSPTSISRKYLAYPSKSSSRTMKVIRRKHGFYASVKRRTAKPKLLRRDSSTPEVQVLSDIKQDHTPGQSRSDTINSILSVKELLPVLEVSPHYNGSRTRVKKHSWATESCANYSPSLTGCSSISSSIASTRVGSPVCKTISKYTAICLPDESASTPNKKMLKTRNLETFTAANATNTSSVQTLAARRTRKRVSPRAPLRLRGECSAQVKGENNISAADGDTRIAKKSLAPRNKAELTPTTKSSRRPPISRPAPEFPHSSEEIITALKDLQSLVLKGQKELRDDLAEIKAQVKSLQELCAVTYVSVDDGTRDLALKADQLAAWVQMERKLDIGSIRTTMEDVLASKSS